MLSFIYVTTIDGRISALDASNEGRLVWSKQIHSGPLISSNLHDFKLNYDGQTVRLVPSLIGNIYKLCSDGVRVIRVEKDFINAISELVGDLAVCGGSEDRTYGILAENGKTLYSHSTNSEIYAIENRSSAAGFSNDLLFVRQKMKTLKVFEKRSGVERFNFCVVHNELSILNAKERAVENFEFKNFDCNFEISISDGIIHATCETRRALDTWKHQFLSPITGVWRMNSTCVLELVNNFRGSDKIFNGGTKESSLFLGVYKKQPYIQELPSCSSKNNEFLLGSSNCNVPKDIWIERCALLLQRSKGVFLYANKNESRLQNVRNAIEPLFKSQFVNDFEFVRCLGEGGFGQVFQAKNRFDEKDYAIKRIELQISNEERHHKSVLREVRALADCSHPNIVRYYRAWLEKPPVGWQELQDSKWSLKDDSAKNFENKNPVDDCDDLIIQFKSNLSKDCKFYPAADRSIASPDNLPTSNSPADRSIASSNNLPTSRTYFYIQMELCQASNLAKWLRITKLEQRQPYVAEIFKQIIDGVKYVHGKKLIHRDLKPDNIFFTENYQIKIGDFGLVGNFPDSLDCKFVNKDCECQTHCIGTQFYMAPEIYKHYDSKVDIYSLGIIFFELLEYFNTQQHRQKKLYKLSIGRYPCYFPDRYPAAYKLICQMVNDDPDKRPTIGELKERFLDLAHFSLSFGNHTDTKDKHIESMQRHR